MYRGKFGTQPSSTGLSLSSNYDDIAKIIQDPNETISDLVFATEKSILVSHKTKLEACRGMPNTSAIMAIFTTSWARIVLYRHLQDIMKHTGDDKCILYLGWKEGGGKMLHSQIVKPSMNLFFTLSRFLLCRSISNPLLFPFFIHWLGGNHP